MKDTIKNWINKFYVSAQEGNQDEASKQPLSEQDQESTSLETEVEKSLDLFENINIGRDRSIIEKSDNYLLMTAEYEGSNRDTKKTEIILIDPETKKSKLIHEIVGDETILQMFFDNKNTSIKYLQKEIWSGEEPKLFSLDIPTLNTTEIATKQQKPHRYETILDNGDLVLTLKDSKGIGIHNIDNDTIREFLLPTKRQKRNVYGGFVWETKYEGGGILDITTDGTNITYVTREGDCFEFNPSDFKGNMKYIRSDLTQEIDINTRSRTIHPHFAQRTQDINHVLFQKMYEQKYDPSNYSLGVLDLESKKIETLDLTEKDIFRKAFLDNDQIAVLKQSPRENQELKILNINTGWCEGSLILPSEIKGLSTKYDNLIAVPKRPFEYLLNT